MKAIWRGASVAIGVALAATTGLATIVIVDSFGLPNIKSDLAVFDRSFDLPAPP